MYRGSSFSIFLLTLVSFCPLPSSGPYLHLPGRVRKIEERHPFSITAWLEVTPIIPFLLCWLQLSLPAHLTIAGDEECRQLYPGQRPGEWFEGISARLCHGKTKEMGALWGPFKQKPLKQMEFIGKLEVSISHNIDSADGFAGIGTGGCSNKNQLFFLPPLWGYSTPLQAGLSLLFARAFIPAFHSLPF